MHTTLPRSDFFGHVSALPGINHARLALTLMLHSHARGAVRIEGDQHGIGFFSVQACDD